MALDTILARLLVAALFGGMLLFAGGFAALAFRTLPPAEARRLIRQAFPPFYAWVVGAASLAAAATLAQDRGAALVLGLIALSTLPTWAWLMPAINRAADAGRRRRFQALHTASVAVTLAHLAAAGWVLVRLA